ncbi:3-deoxy-D-manno-octulosonic acid transferase [Pseudophaeobacter sp. EL27]|uniref:3-deoxy-D-manno-octulosonic acid transferase n=1 Tax=Pseudophaeobacter sp. EL27 TaxID=2107580 RepID=UPI000EFC3888|nr:glycosyltransferase N-terminal domain-containing protein [Pseudophaeobacter sp. EL27]
MAEPHTLSSPARPAGEVLWVHATSIERFMALCDIGHRLKAMRPDLVVLATWETDMGEVPEVDGCDYILGPLPGDQTSESRAFLNQWRPDLCLWAGGQLRRGMLRQMREQGVSALLVDILDSEMPTRKLRWLPDQRHRIFSGFDAIYTPSKLVRSQLLRGPFSAEHVLLTSRLRLSTVPPGCNHDDLADLQQSLGSRPAWLAARAQLEELPTLLEAHRTALRLLHRMLLVIALDNPECRARARNLVQASGLQCADWDAGDELSDYTQILITDSANLGLWYRLAPITLLASSLMQDMPGQNPLDALALGSVVLHGPGSGHHRAIYSQLAALKATKQVNSAQELAEMVIHLSAPDMAAKRALAGWTAVTEGAEMTDQLIDRVQDILDLREDQDATS